MRELKKSEIEEVSGGIFLLPWTIAWPVYQETFKQLGEGLNEWYDGLTDNIRNQNH